MQPHIFDWYVASTLNESRCWLATSHCNCGHTEIEIDKEREREREHEQLYICSSLMFLILYQLFHLFSFSKYQCRFMWVFCFHFVNHHKKYIIHKKCNESSRKHWDEIKTFTWILRWARFWVNSFNGNNGSTVTEVHTKVWKGWLRAGRGVVVVVANGRLKRDKLMN